MAKRKLSVLGALIDLSRSGEVCYRQAAEATGNAHLKSLYFSRANEMAVVAQALQRQWLALGGVPVAGGGMSEGSSRLLRQVSRVAERGDAALLRTCARGEKRARKTWEAALRTGTLGGPLRALVESRYADARQTRVLFRDLSERYRAAA